MDTSTETHRHRCEVRQVLRWRQEHGSEWVMEWLRGAVKFRGQAAADQLEHDAREQWSRGNRGAAGVWR